MLPVRQVVFTGVEGVLDKRGATSDEEVTDGIELLNRRGLPWVLCTHKTRSEIDPLRRKVAHSHPFLTERGGGLFVPDGYFNFHLDGATRIGRHFCVPFARSSEDAANALKEIADEARADIVGLSDMSIREIARNAGISQEEAERYKEREFSELFFFAGETEKTTKRFCDIAAEKGWQLQSGEPFWEIRATLRSGSQAPIQYLMNIYRKSGHSRLRSVGIGKPSSDSYLLSVTDIAFLLPDLEESTQAGSARVGRAIQIEQSGPAGWRKAVEKLLQGS